MMKNIVNSVVHLCMGMDVQIAQLKNIDMDMEQTNVFGVVLL